MATGLVLVGTDGSWHSTAVLHVAAREASLRGAELAVVTVVREVADPRYSLTALLAEERRAAEVARWRTGEAVVRVRSRYPGLEVSTHLVRDRDLGWPDEAVRLGAADLLVLGAHGAHAGPVFGLGTVSRFLLKITACPVLVVPDRRPGVVSRWDDGGTGGPVLAAVGPAGGEEVLAVARREAALRGTGVHAVRVIRPGDDAERVRGEISGLVADVDRSADGVEVVVETPPGAPADVVLRRAEAFALVVVGTRGPAALAGLTADSVARAVLDRCPCPVLVVAPRTARAPLGPSRPAAPAR